MSRQNSSEDIFDAVTNPVITYKFEGKEIPKGSDAFQLVITDVQGENKEDTITDDEDKEKFKKYHGRRRATIAHVSHSDHPEWNIFRSNMRRMSTLEESGQEDEPEVRRSRSSFLTVPNNRSRSLSPLSPSLRRNSVHNVAFGSSKDRETVIK